MRRPKDWQPERGTAWARPGRSLASPVVSDDGRTENTARTMTSLLRFAKPPGCSGGGRCTAGAHTRSRLRQGASVGRRRRALCSSGAADSPPETHRLNRARASLERSPAKHSSRQSSRSEISFKKRANPKPPTPKPSADLCGRGGNCSKTQSASTSFYGCKELEFDLTFHVRRVQSNF